MPRPSSRDRIARTALELFEARGYDAVTVAEIAAAAGVTERTVYSLYGSKLDVLLGDVAERTSELVNVLYRQPLALGVIDALLGALDATVPSAEVLEVDRRRAMIMFSSPTLTAEWSAYEHDLAGQFAEWVAQRSGAEARSVPVRVFAAALVAARRVAIEEWVVQPETDLMSLAEVALGDLRSHPLNDRPL